MSNKQLRGVLAAVGTPRRPDGTLDVQQFRQSLAFLMEHGVRGFTLNGATGEYCLVTAEDLEELLAAFRATVPAESELVCGIGAAGISGTLRRARVAAAYGASHVLLPAPHFFRYAQQDVAAYCREVAGRVETPVLLYNLPCFTTGFETDTALELIGGCPNIAGIKDSSGSLETLRALTRSGVKATRIVGSDEVLPQALAEDVCDGVISGIAGVVPELIQELYANRAEPSSAAFGGAAVRLNELIHHISGMPAPWGLKWIGETRGAGDATFSQPLTPHRIDDGRAVQQWFRSWWNGALPGNEACRMAPRSQLEHGGTHR